MNSTKRAITIKPRVLAEHSLHAAVNHRHETAAEVKGKGHTSPNLITCDSTRTHVCTKLHQFLISSFSVFVLTDTQTAQLEIILCFASTVSAEASFALSSVHMCNYTRFATSTQRKLICAQNIS